MKDRFVNIYLKQRDAERRGAGTHLILIVGKHAGPPGPHVCTGEVWIARTAYKISFVPIRREKKKKVKQNTRHKQYRAIVIAIVIFLSGK